MLDVTVFGVPNLDFGEEVKAVVQPVELPESSKGKMSCNVNSSVSAGRPLADLKCPRSIEFRAELPHDPSGNMMKRKLRGELHAAMEAS